ncbi:MAG: metal-dependent hydrolase [Halobacteriota archaeon]
MPDPITHLAVAVAAVVLYFDRRHWRYALLLVPLAVLPDFDVLVPHAHRVLAHTVFLVAPFLAIALYGLATKRKLLFDVGLVASFCVFSHLVLDFFDGTEALFYPLSMTRYGFGYLSLVFRSIALLPGSLRLYGYFVALLYQQAVISVGILLCFGVIGGMLVVKRQLQLKRFS